MNTSISKLIATRAAVGFLVLSIVAVLPAKAAHAEDGVPPERTAGSGVPPEQTDVNPPQSTGPQGKMYVPPPPKPVNKRGLKISTEVVSRACGNGEKNPGHDVYVVAKRAKNDSVKWRTMLWTWVHPCTQKTIDGKPVALGHVGILPVSLRVDKNTLHIMSNRDQDFEVTLKDGKLREAPAPVLDSKGP